MTSQSISSAEIRHVGKAPRYVYLRGDHAKAESESLRIVGIALDITDRKAAARRDSDLRLVTDNLPALISYVDTDLCYRFVSKGYERAFHSSASDIVGRHVRQLMGDENFNRLKDKFDTVLSGKSISYESVLDLPDSGLRDIHASYVPDVGEDGNVRGFFALVTDVTEQNRAERKFKMLLDSAPDAMVLIDQEGKIVLVNNQTERMFRYSREELVGRSVETLVPEKFRVSHKNHRAEYSKRPTTRSMGDAILEALRKDGSSFPVEISLSPIDTEQGVLFCAAVRDVTKRCALEEQFRQSQKMESVGQLAGGIAHDFNNLLTVILGYADLLRSAGVADVGTPELDGIERASRRAADLTGQLLAFSRRQVLRPEVLDLNGVIEDNLKMLPRLMGEDIELTTRLARINHRKDQKRPPCLA